jgi:hypothetical protein
MTISSLALCRCRARRPWRAALRPRSGDLQVAQPASPKSVIPTGAAAPFAAAQRTDHGNHLNISTITNARASSLLIAAICYLFSSYQLLITVH